jgi:hypothetical protein
MKYLKYVFPLLVVVVLLTIALPAAAQGPITVWTTGGNLPIFVRTAGTNNDPFGGFCRNYLGATAAGAGPQLGATADFGLNPFGVCAVDGGVPSAASGDGTSPRNAIYVGGAWDPARQVPENELPACATLKVPAGTSRWLKSDTWRNKDLHIWLDDERNDATAPSGRAVFGAADAYMFGVAPGDGWSKNQFFDSGNSSITSYRYFSGPGLEGFVMAIYDPDNLKPNYYFKAPNGWILTENVSGSGSLQRSAAGQPNGQSNASGGAGGVHGYAQYNYAEPSHLLWYQGRFDGWAYIRVFNQMIWDGVVTVCSYRATR